MIFMSKKQFKKLVRDEVNTLASYRYSDMVHVLEDRIKKEIKDLELYYKSDKIVDSIVEIINKKQIK